MNIYFEYINVREFKCRVKRHALICGETKAGRCFNVQPQPTKNNLLGKQGVHWVRRQ